MPAAIDQPVGRAQERVYATSRDRVTAEPSASAVSWGAIIGGAVAAAGLALILLELGAGIGLSIASPWPSAGPSAATFSIAAGIWLIVVQWIAAAIGGYLAGRLRTRWVGLHTDEVFFRDTAHGFLSWALATVLAAAVVAGVAVATAAGTAALAGQGVAGATQGASEAMVLRSGNSAAGGDFSAYAVDTMFRSNQPDSSAAQDVRGEAGRILARGLQNGSLGAEDRTYLAQLVAARAGISQDEAQKRVDDALGQMKAAETKAREAADVARRATASAAIVTALAMLIGAFIASASGALGGRLRDSY